MQAMREDVRGRMPAACEAQEGDAWQALYRHETETTTQRVSEAVVALLAAHTGSAKEKDGVRHRACMPSVSCVAPPVSTCSHLLLPPRPAESGRRGPAPPSKPRRLS